MTGRIPQAAIEDLLSRIDIVDIIQTRVPIVKKGQNYQSRCPFHDEKTPSFTVSQHKQFYYCFGCGASGNVINFLMNYDRMEFLEALSWLASQAGIELQQDKHSLGFDPKHQNLYPIMEQIALIYQKNLRQSQQAINYLKSRGLSGRTAHYFMIGYARSDWDHIAKKFNKKALIDTGMIICKDSKTTYDRFRDRIIFPIRDLRGRVIAFGGRNLNDCQMPKYLNSPETALFHKSSQLYGLYEARKVQQPLKQLLIVEGYMDVIALTEHGLTYAVATLGTAINTKHIQKALRYTNKLVFCFDGDTAGKQAAWKALTIALPLLRDDIHLRFLFLPDHEDPDTLVQKIKKDAFEKLIEQAASLSQIFFETLSQQFPPHSIDGRTQYAYNALKHINTMPKGIFYQFMKQELAQRLNANIQELESLGQNTNKIKPFTQTNHHQLNPAQLATALLLQYPHLAQEVHKDHILQSIDIQGKSLLLDLIQWFRSQPTLTTGTLLALPLSEAQKKTISMLARMEFPLSKTGLVAEYKGALKRLEELATQQQLATLIQKAKITPLCPEEKQRLSNLLAKKSVIKD